MTPRTPLTPVRTLLAVDAGGTSTRAVLLTEDGTVLGRGASGAGNPTSAGPEPALASLVAAAQQAGPPASTAVLAMAGERHLLPLPRLAAALGLPSAADVVVVSDALAMFRSAADEPDGGAIVCGTGSNAVRVEGGTVVATVGGAGWLLGDPASGFAVGHAVVRAVVAALHGTGPATSLTAAVLAATGGSEATLVARSYADRPVALARFAPLAFEHRAGDEVAQTIVTAAQDDLARMIGLVAAVGEPLVIGGSVAHRGLLAHPPSPALAAATAGLDVRAARDGLLGAAALALPGVRVRELG